MSDGSDGNGASSDGGESRSDGGVPIVEGGIAGIVAWLVGYALTYLTVAPTIRESALNRIVEGLDGEPATYEMVGWVFYNAHFVEVVFEDVPLLGGGAATYIGGDEGFTVLLYVVPVGLLLAAGLALARYDGAAGTTRGALVGASVLPGYLLASVAGVFLFEVTVGGASGAPDFVAGVFLAGLVYPGLFATAGGVLGAVFESRERES
ncbi:MAG: hypothetical protein ACOCR0_02730 [Haloferacaceae archaeon]